LTIKHTKEYSLGPNYGNASKFSYLKNFNNGKYIIQT
jgi:hypothetical protein